MKAAVYEKYGGPEVVQVKSVEKPIPKDDEVLVKIHATTVNRTDCGFRIGWPLIVRFFSGWFKKKLPILGNEFAGEIEAIGKSVQSFKVGDEVFGMRNVKFGTHAQYLALPENGAITHKPKNFSFEEAAAICEGHFYALNYLTKINLQKGDRILINGATGAIGTSGVQLAKHFGAKITAVGNSKNIELVKSLGAEKIIDYKKEDFTKVLNEKFDYVFDAVGKSSFGRCKHLLEPKGSYFSTELGSYWQNPWFGMLTYFLGRMPFQSGKKVLFPIPDDAKAREDVLFFKELAETGKIRAVIDRRYPLDEIVEAYKYVDAGEKTGSVVITVDH